MHVPTEVIYFLSVLACAYFSYRVGYKNAVPDAVDQVLFSLESQGIIDIDDDGTVKKAK